MVRIPQVSEREREYDGWTPTAENINALPEPIRNYIHLLETRADPAGELRELVLLRDQMALLADNCGNLRL